MSALGVVWGCSETTKAEKGPAGYVAHGGKPAMNGPISSEQEVDPEREVGDLGLREPCFLAATYIQHPGQGAWIMRAGAGLGVPSHSQRTKTLPRGTIGPHVAHFPTGKHAQRLIPPHCAG